MGSFLESNSLWHFRPFFLIGRFNYFSVGLSLVSGDIQSGSILFMLRYIFFHTTSKGVGLSAGTLQSGSFGCRLLHACRKFFVNDKLRNDSWSTEPPCRHLVISPALYALWRGSRASSARYCSNVAQIPQLFKACKGKETQIRHRTATRLKRNLKREQFLNYVQKMRKS